MLTEVLGAGVEEWREQRARVDDVECFDRGEEELALVEGREGLIPCAQDNRGEDRQREESGSALVSAM
jgi:hypothetical protein